MGEQKKSDDHLMKQDASSVNPMKLTALTPEVVCSFRESNLSSSFCFLSFFRSVLSVIVTVIVIVMVMALVIVLLNEV